MLKKRYTKKQLREIKEINEFRISMGLPPILKGKVKCLRCEKKFQSDNIASEKLCYNCRYGVEEN